MKSVINRVLLSILVILFIITFITNITILINTVSSFVEFFTAYTIIWMLFSIYWVISIYKLIKDSFLLSPSFIILFVIFSVISFSINLRGLLTYENNNFMTISFLISVITTFVRIILLGIYYLLFYVNYFTNIIDKVRPKKVNKKNFRKKTFKLSELPVNYLVIFNKDINNNRSIYRKMIGPWNINDSDLKNINKIFLIEKNELIGIYEFKKSFKMIKITDKNYNDVKKLIQDLGSLSKVRNKYILNIENKNYINTVIYRKYISKKIIHNETNEYFIT